VSLVIELLDYFGIVVFAVSGALAAARARMDVVGFALLGVVTGIGGRSVRDLLLGRLPVFWIEQPQYIALCGRVGADLRQRADHCLAAQAAVVG